jgi:hypothetical protein
MLRERYRDLSVEPGGARRMNHDSPRGYPLPIPPFRDPYSNGNIRTFEFRDAWQTLGRSALNFHRRKEWTLRRLERHCRRAEIRAGWPIRDPAPLAMVPLRDLGGDGGEGGANFRREISAMMTVRRGLKLLRVFTSRPMRLAASPLHAISATIRHRSAPSRKGT